jgi:hypothetical protein
VRVGLGRNEDTSATSNAGTHSQRGSREADCERKRKRN